MPKLREHTNRTTRANQPHTTPKRGNKSATPASSPNKSTGITPERYPRMSRSAVTFARQMRANPHVQAVMRDLADK